MGKKNASARIKNKIKNLVARSIAQMERSVGRSNFSFKSQSQKLKKS
ncbi:hypothetical protein KAZ82_01045 [Candidatus Babeliales bacterium]|nr:hypothetical protein [Candidatus Babeliales bacterium]